MKKWIWIAVAVAVVLGAVWFAQSRVARGAAELIAEQGEIQLREPLRPIRGSTKVLILALDGVGDEALRRALATGMMPRLAEFLGTPTGPNEFTNAYAVPDALSILPSTTWAAWPAVFTGQPAAQTGVTGNEWFERETMRFFAPGPTSVESIEHTVAMYTDDLLGGQIRVPTLFEKADLRAHVSMQGVYRGADLVTIPNPADVGTLFGALARGVGEDGIERGAYQQLDESSIDRLIEGVRRHGLPDIQVVYFPGVDLFTHLTGNALEEKQRYLREILDPQIARVLNLYAEHRALEQTYVVIVADHGHTPVLDDLRYALGEEDGGIPPEILRQLGFRVRPLEVEVAEDRQDFQAVVAYQGAMAYIYLADRSTCPNPGDVCDWRRPPRMDEDVLPVTRAFYEANLTGLHSPRLRGTLEMIFARDPVTPGQTTRPFEVFDGQRLVPIGSYLAANPKPDLLDLESRMRGLSEGPYGHHAGDVLLLAYSGRHRPITDRYYFSAKYHSWHGSPAAHDSHVPLVVARRGTSGSVLRERVSAAIGDRPTQLSITPLILSLLQD